MKICLFGGTFDPPHIGHLIVGETVKEAENIDKMIFIPAFIPPHKHKSYISSIEERQKMLRLCMGNNTNFEISDTEIKRGDISYTIHTIHELKSQYHLDKDHTYFLMGSDSLMEFHQWKNHEEIMEECQVLVAVRQGFRSNYISRKILSKIRFVDTPQISISSSGIRERIRLGLTVRFMVPDPVWVYIQRKGLYQ